jgi:hypothetical protein
MRTEFWFKSLKEGTTRKKRRWEDTIKIILEKQVWRVWIGLIWLRRVTGGQDCEHGK